jgi:hypothetical protein
MKVFSRFRLVGLSFLFAAILSTTQHSLGQAVIKLKPSSPKELLVQIYNNVLAGNDRLSDIENYMSAGLKRDYKKALKSVKKGKNCGIPRILVNGIFSGKLKGFNVEEADQQGWSTQANVTLDTDAKNLPPSSELRKFDPKIYETVSYTLVRRFVDWKIDNIRASEPDTGHAENGVEYKAIDLREMLRACK